MPTRRARVFRDYSTNGNTAQTAGNAYYTNGKNGGSGLSNRRAPHGYRMMTTTGQNVRYKENNGQGKQYGNQVLVSRKQQYRAIRTAFGMVGG